MDDGSTDGSKELIKKSLRGRSETFIDIPSSIGNCKAFNKGFFISKGNYVIDLAADDLLLPERIEQGIKTFSLKKIGVEFCNVLNIDVEGNDLDVHFSKKTQPLEGDLYIQLIKQYFISPPGMMIKREVLDDLNGYDESMSYEDFDFWIRSSRKYRYGYTNEVLVKKRILKNSLSSKQFELRSKHQKSTLKVCQKIKELNQTKAEDSALRKRCLYEIKQCLKQRNWTLIPAFLKLIS